MELPFDETRCAVFLINEEAAKGTGGVLLVRGEEWAYVMPTTDVFPEAFVTELNVLMQDDKAEHFFIILREPTTLRVAKLSKSVAMQRAVATMASDTM